MLSQPTLWEIVVPPPRKPYSPPVVQTIAGRELYSAIILHLLDCPAGLTYTQIAERMGMGPEGYSTVRASVEALTAIPALYEDDRTPSAIVIGRKQLADWLAYLVADGRRAS